MVKYLNHSRVIPELLGKDSQLTTIWLWFNLRFIATTELILLVFASWEHITYSLPWATVHHSQCESFCSNIFTRNSYLGYFVKAPLILDTETNIQYLYSIYGCTVPYVVLFIFNSSLRKVFWCYLQSYWNYQKLIQWKLKYIHNSAICPLHI